MSVGARMIVSLLIRLLLIALGLWFAFAPSALPGDPPLITRGGLMMLCFIMNILVGEVARNRLHVDGIVGALRQVQAGGGLEGSMAPFGDVPERDPREAVDTLIQALGVTKGETKAKVHTHLKRLTGQDLPPDAPAWSSWWETHREDYKGIPG